MNPICDGAFGQLLQLWGGVGGHCILYNVLEMDLFWEERVILMLDIQKLNRIDLSFEVIALISGVCRNSLLIPCGCFQGLLLLFFSFSFFYPSNLFPLSFDSQRKTSS